MDTSFYLGEKPSLYADYQENENCAGEIKSSTSTISNIATTTLQHPPQTSLSIFIKTIEMIKIANDHCRHILEAILGNKSRNESPFLISKIYEKVLEIQQSQIKVSSALKRLEQQSFKQEYFSLLLVALTFYEKEALDECLEIQKSANDLEEETRKGSFAMGFVRIAHLNTYPLIEKLFIESTETSKAWLILSETLFTLNRPAEAKKAAEFAERIDPSCRESKRMLALIDFQQKNYSSALKHLNSIKDIKEEDFLMKIEIFYRQTFLDPALETLKEARRKFPSSSKVLILLNKICKAMGELEAAENALKTSINLQPKDPDRWADYVDFILDNKLPEAPARALDIINQFTENQAGEKDQDVEYATKILELRTKTLIRLGYSQTYSLWDDLLKVVTHNPKAYKILEILSNTYLEHGMIEVAEMTAREAYRINNSTPSTLMNLGKIFLSLGKHSEALILYQKAVEIDPFLIPAWFTVAEIYYQMGAKRETLRSYTQLTELIRKDKLALAKLSQSFLNLYYFEQKTPNEFSDSEKIDFLNKAKECAQLSFNLGNRGVAPLLAEIIRLMSAQKVDINGKDN